MGRLKQYGLRFYGCIIKNLIFFLMIFLMLKEIMRVNGFSRDPSGLNEKLHSHGFLRDPKTDESYAVFEAKTTDRRSVQTNIKRTLVPLFFSSCYPSVTIL